MLPNSCLEMPLSQQPHGQRFSSASIQVPALSQKLELKCWSLALNFRSSDLPAGSGSGRSDYGRSPIGHRMRGFHRHQLEIQWRPISEAVPAATWHQQLISSWEPADHHLSSVSHTQWLRLRWKPETLVPASYGWLPFHTGTFLSSVSHCQNQNQLMYPQP